LTLNFTQPLLQDFRIDAARAGLETSQISRSIADLQVQQDVISLEAAVKIAYLNLIGAIEGQKVAKQNMDLAQLTLTNARARVKVGQSPQIEIIQAEAEVAGNEQNVISADAAISTAEDNLRQLILDPARPDYWTIKLEPSDTIQLTEVKVDLDAAIKNALASRLDLIEARRNMDITDLNLRLSRNNTLPAVDFGLTYQASGTAGTQFEYGGGFPPSVVSRSDRSYSSALSDTFGGAYPSWTLGVNVGYPIGMTGARVALAQSQVRKRQLELANRDLELQIVRDVRDAARQVVNSFEQVRAARRSREARQLEVEAEDRRFAVGLSTPLEQQVRQRSLAGARIQELQAMINYNRAIIAFERVQRIR
jgi:HAE1 family hydrophobic/amphiphilic exporter-1